MYMIRVHQMPLMSTNMFFYLILKCSNGQDINMRQIQIQFKGPYADHILIPQGSTGSSTFFDIKWKPIFFWLQIQNFSIKFFVVLEIWQKMWN